MSVAGDKGEGKSNMTKVFGLQNTVMIFKEREPRKRMPIKEMVNTRDKYSLVGEDIEFEAKKSTRLAM